ncbi:uncharacterized protein M6B38_167080 [Iris pallida]|uniref:Uncharacterized protein n=1 Tax=Iris pallida TaxID=29817 RepID=A0AAX6EWK3_IRIPA|nr:uncharacterized protein M6B38_167080 [Iris pallida]
METEKSGVQNSVTKLRESPRRRKERVYVGCGAGFAGDRPAAALKLLRRVPLLDYLVLECLAERTLADRYHAMVSGGKGYDPRISEWMSLLLPLAVERGVCIITNMGAMDPLGAQEETLNVANKLEINITVSVAYELSPCSSGRPLSPEDYNKVEGFEYLKGASTYLGAAPIVQCLERYNPHVIITSRVADAALFLAPMVYELGWNWNDYQQLAQGSLAGHLLECGCQLTGGYFMHPGDKYRDLSCEQLLDLSLPFAEVGFGGEVCVAKADDSGGALNYSTCAQQLLYEIGDPGSYITPDVIIDLRDVHFCPLSNDKVICGGAKPSNSCFPDKLLHLVPTVCGWKGWGEISYGGYGCVRRAEAADFLVRSWMDEAYPAVKDCIVSYIIGYDSLKATNLDKGSSSQEQIMDVRLRMDGLFKLKEQAVHFIEEFIALYTNGPAGGGGISTGHKREIVLQKELVERTRVFWQSEAKQTDTTQACSRLTVHKHTEPSVALGRIATETVVSPSVAPAPSCKKILLYEVAHSRAGDKGNDLNFSIIPHYPPDIRRLKMVITPAWVKDAVSVLLPSSIKRNYDWLNQVSVEIYEVRGVHSLNVVVRNVLDGGVNCSRRIDRHGKTVSDLILFQEVELPP